MNSDYIIDDKLYFSSDIPKYKCFDDDGSYPLATARLSLMHKDKTVFSTDIYYNPVEHVFCAQLAQIISAYMQNNYISIAEFTIELVNPESNKTIDTISFRTLFYRGHILQDPEDFLKNNFLNDQNVVQVPQHFVANVFLIEYGGPEMIDFYITPKGSSVPIWVMTTQYETGIVQAKIDIDSILAFGVEHDRIDPDTEPARLTLKADNRVLDFFIVPMRPAFAMNYLNGFNLPETFWSFGSWKSKSLTKAETANVSGNKIAYNITHEDSFELKTHPMHARDMFSGFNFLGITPAEILLFLGRDAFLFKATLSEVSFDNDPFSDELTLVEMKADVTQSMGHLRFNSDDRFNIFSNNFNTLFQ